MNKIIDGKRLALEHEQKVRENLQKLRVRPKVVSFLIGDDPNSVMYTNMKQQKASEVGIEFNPLRYPKDVSFEEIIKKIEKLNQDLEITGIMIQLPLPKEFLKNHQVSELLESIDPQKDIDGLNPRQSKFTPATAQGVISILDSLNLNYEKTIFAVVGSEGEVGMAIVFELTNKDAQVFKVDKKLPDTKLEDIKNADVVISATGVKNLIKAGFIKKGAILIDVGLGDFDPVCYNEASAYTPKVGGTGPMTVISLMENILKATSIL